MQLYNREPEATPHLDDIRTDLFYSFLERGIKDEDELHLFIRAYLNYFVPRHRICPHHVSPFDFIAEQYFERKKSVLGFANRTGGKTLSTQILSVTECLTKPGVEIVSSGAVRTQADRGYTFVQEMLGGERLVAEQVLFSLRSKTRFLNGSTLEIATASYGGYNSPHPNKTRIDEVELMHWSVLQQAMSMSLESNGWAAGDCFTSTRKITSGTMQKLLDMAVEKNLEVMSWCIWEILEPCTRLCHGDPVYGDCPAFAYRDKDGKEREMCGGKAHDLPPGGFFKIADFVKKVSLMDRETWETEWLNLRPSSGALVYGEYFKDEPPFVVPSAEAAELLKRAKEEHWPRVIGIDFGANFYAGYYMQDPRNKTWYQHGEYWHDSSSDLPLSKHAQNVRERDPLGWDNRTIVFADPSGRQAIRDLEEFKLFAQPANNDVYGGINFVKKMLQIRPDGLPGLRFFHSCSRIRKELGELYIHPLDKGGDPIKDKVLKRDDHGCFVAGTMVETSTGPRPIETIQVGDLVLTRGGYRRVIVSGMTHPSARVMRVDFSNGRRLIGTGNHPIGLANGEWGPLAKLRYGDIVTTCQKSKLSFSMASTSVGIRILLGWKSANTTLLHQGPKKAPWGFFIKKFGSRYTARFLKAIRSIIRILTRSIIRQTISFAFLPQSISVSIGKPEPLSNVSVPSVDNRIVRRSPELTHGSAPTRVSQLFAEAPGATTSSVSANIAVQSLPLTATTPSVTVPVHVRSVSAEGMNMPVYNLTVEGAHEYFANGILVHNCDQMRYALYSFETVGTTKYRMRKLRGVW